MNPGESLIAAELGRALESRTFARSARARDLLRYLIDSKRLGHAGRLKENAIALDVFGRDAATYDSATDGIVRVSVNRLRELLDRYYEGEGARAALRFEIQRGGYVPIIRCATPAGLPPLPRIAVLPLVNFTGEASLDALADGLTEDLIDAMTRVPDVRVIARTSSFRYKGTILDVRQIAAELDVDAVLEGSVQLAGGRLRITAQLILGHDGTHLWSHAFEGFAENRGPLQAALIEIMVRSLGHRDESTEPLVTALEGERVSPMVRNLVDQARVHAALQTAETLRLAESLAREAVALAPEYVAAWSTLADVMLMQRVSWSITWSVDVESIRQPLRRALALFPDHPGALSVRGYDKCVHERRWAEGLIDCERAARLAPNSAVILARLAFVLLSTARFDEAAAHFKTMLELDPYSPMNHYWCSMQHIVVGKWDEALRIITNARQLMGNLSVFENIELGWNIEAGRFGETLPRACAVARANPLVPAFAMRVGQCLAGLGRLEEARAQFVDHGNRCNPDQRDYLMMAIEACGDDTDQFFEHASRAIAVLCPNCALLPIDPLFRRFHDDARWAQLMRSFNRDPHFPFYPAATDH